MDHRKLEDDRVGASPRPAPARSRLQVVTWQGSDAELLDLVRTGGPGATTRLFDRFAPDINRVVWKLLGGDPDHNDLVHDIFIKVAGGIARVRDPDAVASWVVSVAINTVYKELRRRGVRRVFSREHVEPVTIAPIVDFEARELLAKTYSVLDQMPSKERIAFALRYLDQRSVGEIATTCGWSQATVKRRVAAARVRFTKVAQKYPALAARIRFAQDGGTDEP